MIFWLVRLWTLKKVFSYFRSLMNNRQGATQRR